MTISKKALWAAQLKEWPDSIELTIRDMYRWADKGKSVEEKLLRYQQLASAMQYSNYIFYATNPENGYIGCRYGIKGYQYMSGFGKLNGDLV